AGGHAARELRARARVRGMLKQRQTRLLPKPFAKQNRRIYCRRQHRRSYRLSDVVSRREFAWSNLKVNLKTCVARLHHDVVVLNLQLVDAFDVDRKRSAAQSSDGAIKFVIARIRSQIVERQIRQPKRR